MKIGVGAAPYFLPPPDSKTFARIGKLSQKLSKTSVRNFEKCQNGNMPCEALRSLLRPVWGLDDSILIFYARTALESLSERLPLYDFEPKMGIFA